MNIIKNSKVCITTGLFVCLVGVSNPNYAASLDLSTGPLFLGANPQPNIFFSVDDSGSMDWEVTKSPGVAAIPQYSGFPNSGNVDITPTPNDNDEMLESCAGYNVNYYDTNKTYTPWIGEDQAGNAYVDQTITAAKRDPYYTSTSTTNLTLDDCCGGVPGYFLWADAGTIGLYEAGECSDTPTANPIVDYSQFIPVTSMSATEQTNFANWYSYYIKREYVMKRSLSELITDSSSFMGLATLHDNNSVGTPITDMNTQANKDTLLDELFQINSSGGTPLRRLLENTGEYYDQGGSNSDHSPLGFTDSSPILSAEAGGECQQHFAILFTDGEWNGSSPSVGDADNDNNTAFDGGPHALSTSNTLADVAMDFYERDLSTTLDNTIPENDYVDPNTNVIYTDDNDQQHMITYGVSFGLIGTGLTTPLDHDSGTASPPWTNPTNSATKLDDMQHAAFNGRGLFLNASDPQELIDSLADSLSDIEARTSATGTAIAVNSASLNEGSRAYLATFDSSDWSGSFFAFSFDANGDIIQTPAWEASALLPAHASREIYTMTPAGTAVEFKDNASTTDDTSTVETAIGTLAIGGTTYTAAQIINYIRGDQSLESGTDVLRERTSLLGDTVSSSPLSRSTENFANVFLPGAEGDDYNAFVASKFTTFGDNNVIYMGANDGMLHAFRDDSISSPAPTSNGKEIFAYVPSPLHSKLSDLASPAYNHDYYVNGGISVADVWTGSNWKTILVASLGEGGRTVFALDVTNPFSFSQADVLWEYSFDDTGPARSTSDEMGFVLHRPQIVRLNNGDWAVVFGNGYNSASGLSQIFILDAITGDEIEVLDSEVGGTTVATLNGMAMPFLGDDDGNRTVDTIFAGDLKGNLWKFDITASNTNGWESSHKQGSTPEPFFIAYDSGGTLTQAITTRPTVAVRNSDEDVVLFGTGKFIENSDADVPVSPATYQLQTFYGIIDNGTDQVDGRDTANLLQQQTILTQTTFFGDTVRTISENDVTGSETGWYLDLDDPNVAANDGERVIVNPILRGDLIFFFTYITADNPCAASSSGFIMVMDALNGANLEDAVFDSNGDGIIDDTDLVDTDGDGVGDTPAAGKSGAGGAGGGTFISGGGAEGALDSILTSDDSSGTQEIDQDKIATEDYPSGRQSWRQLR